MLSVFNDLGVYKYILMPALVVALATVTYFLTKKYLTRILHSLICSKNHRWRPIFDAQKPFNQLNFLAPTIFIYFGLQYIPEFAAYGARVLNFYIAISITIMANSVINTFLDIYELYPISKDRPIKSYTQMFGIFIYLVGGIVATCRLFDSDPWVFIQSIGALTAIIVLVFRDTILSFIAGIQILSNNLIRKDDWIEVPSFGANGAVIDVALHVVRVQNWDKTIVIIPTYKLIEGGFKNWRSMYDSGGRRIKRSLLIDQTSVRFIDQKVFDSLSKNPYVLKHMKPYFEEMEKNNGKSDVSLNSQTNLGVFRRYVESYLLDHPKINKQLLFMIRLLDPTPTGIPLELYMFTQDTEWAKHENVQSEVFEHLMAIMPAFGLYIYQRPSGYDVERVQDAGRLIQDNAANALRKLV